MQNIEEIYMQHSNTVYKYLFCLTGNEDLSEELTQETFAIAVKEIVKFKGFNEVTLSYKDVETILNNPSCDYYKILEHIKGIYCLTDTFTGKLYIGSATGKDGIAGRWKDYIITQDGGNKELISLKEKECGDYFKKNIKFVLIEFFDISISDEYIKQRERYWKKAFETVKNGYNDNY